MKEIKAIIQPHMLRRVIEALHEMSHFPGLTVTDAFGQGIWLYRDTQDTAKIAALSMSIFWLVLPSLVLFLVLPALLRHGVHFPSALGLATAAMLAAYGGMAAVLRAFHITL
jgi:Nitrogen regulatory protein P-II